MYRKRFRSEARFDAEIANYELFADAGLCVPRRYRVDRRYLHVDYEVIRGMPPDARHLDRLLPLIVRVHEEILPRLVRRGDTETIQCRYRRDIADALRPLGLWSDVLCGLVDQTFFPSVFRDAKPANWIVADSGAIVLIDFDYVVISGPLQDFAQLMTGIWVNSDIICTAAMLYDSIELIIEQKPWNKYYACPRRDKNILWAAAMLLCLSKKKVYCTSKLEAQRINALEHLVVSSWPE